MKVRSGSIERSLLSLSIGSGVVVLLSLASFGRVERELAANIGLNDRVVVPARRVASALDSAVSALSARQDQLTQAKTLEMVEAAAPRGEIVGAIRDTEQQLVRIAKHLRDEGGVQLGGDLESTLVASLERYLDSDHAHLQAVERKHRALANLDGAARLMDRRLRNFVQQARSLSGRLRLEEGRRARALHASLGRGEASAALLPENRALLSPATRQRSGIITQVLALASDLHVLTVKLGAVSADTQLRSLWSNELVPAQDRLHNALADLVLETAGQPELGRAALELQQEAVSIAGLVSATELTNSLVALAQAKIDTETARARARQELFEAAKEPTRLTQQLVAAVQAQANLLSRRLTAVASVARWLLLAMVILALGGGVFGFRSLRHNITELRTTNANLVRLKDQLTELNQSLEAKVQERTQALNRQNRAMRLVLDNVEQGFVTIDRQGAIVGERSARFDSWLGALEDTATNFGQHLARKDPAVGSFLEQAWEQVESGVLPAEVSLQMLPRRAQIDERTIEIGYKVVTTDPDGVPASSLVIMTDISEQLERARAEAGQRECAAMLAHFLADRVGFAEFFRESDGSIAGLVQGRGDYGDQFRAIHTLKGNAGMFGLVRMAECCHRLESKMQAERCLPSDQDRETIVALWSETTSPIRSLMRDRSCDWVEIERRDVERVVRLARELRIPAELSDLIARWRHEPVRQRLEQLAQLADRLARQLGKDLEVVVDHGEVRLPSVRLSPFWGVMVHVVRNAVDHGIEDRTARVAAGKTGRGRVELRAAATEGGFEIRVADDGSGIDWQRLAAKAANLGLPHSNREELFEALFQDGVSTAVEITEVSGRGVGMGAVREVVSRLGGRVHLKSVPGCGTEWVFWLPVALLEEIGPQGAPESNLSTSTPSRAAVS